MKKASLLCSVVIGLTLFAGRVEAQRDSVELKINFTGESHEFSFQTIITDETNNTTQPGEFMSETIFPYLDKTFLLVGQDTFGARILLDPNINLDQCVDSISFSIDSFSHQLRNIFIESDSVWAGGGNDVPVENLKYAVRIDSIPYSESRSSITVTTTLIRGASHWGGGYIGHYEGNPDYTETGSSTDSSLDVDTLSLQLGPISSEVTPSNVQNESSLVIERSETSPSMFFFAPSSQSRELQIMDLLGRTVSILTIPSGNESLELQFNTLAPGYYFVRLGDQVAKFVIPPR